ncbi:hypothetical protein KO561_05160 [Radiobacillus kanasensis]|uniref:hypothetical protein n=1 Tax=Radiobacillus kanasensis TaxID=2844358 RepID=UPI001E43CC67|nr:hypothetical protein [Radiobacillus kanasensis]UFU00341.1 hypothetical protein KO561_05160 [Radiobacillus kanasensis]
MQVPFRVLLPKRIFEQSRNKDEILSAIKEYMQRYPNYVVLRVEKHFAICERVRD